MYKLEENNPKRSGFIPRYPFLAGCKQHSLILLGLIHLGNPFDPSRRYIILAQDNLQASIWTDAYALEHKRTFSISWISELQ